MLDHFGKGVKLIRSFMKKKAKKKKKTHIVVWGFYDKESKACKMHQLYGWHVRVKSTTFQKFDLKVDFLEIIHPTSCNTDKETTKKFK